MEDESLHLPPLEAVNLPIDEMQSVLATVSGYKGGERFNLVKLIARSGASYVGTMSKSITHLVCWKFEGRKYEIARRLKIIVVNHRWIEDCIRQGQRVPEEPYTFQSGEVIGPLRLDIKLVTKHPIAQSIAQKKLKEPVIDTDEYEDMDIAAWVDEDLFPQLRQNQGSNRSAAKTIQRKSMKDHPSCSRYWPENLSEPINLEAGEPSTFQPTHPLTLRDRNYTSPESHGKRRRLVKRHIGQEDLDSTPNMKQQHQEVEVLPENNSRRTLPKSSDVERQDTTFNRHESDRRRRVRWQISDSLDDAEEIEDVNDEYKNGSGHRESSIPGNSEKHLKAPSEDLIDIDRCNKRSSSSELSCVICLTDFSSTRGVLPCGHRFCFECIQTWAQQLASARKPSTCPLCKASFICITKVDDALSSDQKIYSQTIPVDSIKTDFYILPDEAGAPPAPANVASEQVCCRCSSREPEDLLVRCSFCDVRCVHCFCLDPPLFPWTCDYCQDLQMIYHNR